MPLKDSDNLDLNDAPDFISRPPKYTWTEMIKICEQMLPYWNKIRYSKPDPEYIGEPFTLTDISKTSSKIKHTI